MKNILVTLLIISLYTIQSCTSEKEPFIAGSYVDGSYYATISCFITGEKKITYWGGGNDAIVVVKNNKIVKVIGNSDWETKMNKNSFVPSIPVPIDINGDCEIIDLDNYDYMISVSEKLEKRAERLLEEERLKEKERLEMVETNMKYERRQDSLRELRTETNHDGLLYNGETEDYCSNCKGLISKNNETNEIFCWVCKTENDLKYKNITVTAEDTKNFNEMRKIQKMIPGYNTMEAREWMHQKLFEYRLRQK